MTDVIERDRDIPADVPYSNATDDVVASLKDDYHVNRITGVSARLSKDEADWYVSVEALITPEADIHA